MVEMTIEQERKIQCFKANCQYYDHHCISFRGYECSKLGGAKIPCLKSLGHNRNILGHSMKPKFLSNGDGFTDEGR